MKYVTEARLKQLIKEARAHKQDSSQYEQELARLKSENIAKKSSKTSSSTARRGHTRKEGKLRICSMAKVKKSHLRGLEKL